ncbi:MAG: hypothetical protein LCH70_06815 [Proteobacteria bacterium]|nr:hypothetical protein [Pseudomonadota bacterium]
MTHPSANDPHSGDDMPAALRMHLRGLRRDALPGRDLWPAIDARLSDAARDAAPTPRTARPRRPLPAFAAAAVLAVALGLGWQLRSDAEPTAVAGPQDAVPPTAAPAGDGTPAGRAPLVVMADAMAREYQGALREVSAMQPDAPAHASLDQLDASAVAVREALAQDPDAQYLLQQLQRIYAQRLSLTQRLARA